MAGDPIYDCTRTSVNWENTTSTSTSAHYENDIYSVSFTIVRRVQEDLEKIKKLLHQQTIDDMKDTWNNFKNNFKSIPKIRPSVQLRGVCLGGRGWA